MKNTRGGVAFLVKLHNRQQKQQSFSRILKYQINYSSTTCSTNGALVQNGLNIYRGIARTKMELFAEIVNDIKPLTIFAKKLRLRCLIGSSYTFDLGISSTCTLIDYSAHLLEFVVFV